MCQSLRRAVVSVCLTGGWEEGNGRRGEGGDAGEWDTGKRRSLTLGPNYPSVRFINHPHELADNVVILVVEFVSKGLVK